MMIHLSKQQKLNCTRAANITFCKQINQALNTHMNFLRSQSTELSQLFMQLSTSFLQKKYVFNVQGNYPAGGKIIWETVPTR